MRRGSEGVAVAARELVGGGGSVRSREGKQRSEGEGGPESEGEVRGGRGCVASRKGPGKEEAARQGGGGALGRVRSLSPCLLAEVEDDWQAARWAGPASGPPGKWPR